MNAIVVEQTVTTKELAEQLNTTKDVVIANARKCLPDKIFEHGKSTYWNQAEVTILLDYMKTHTSNNRSVELNSTVENASTDLTPALKIKKAMELMQEGYQEEIARLEALNKEQEQKLVEQQPKVESYDQFVAREKFCNFTDAANYLHIKRNELIEILKTKYIYKNSVGEYRAYSEYTRYFALRPFEKGQRVGQQLMFTIEGLEYFKKQIA